MKAAMATPRAVTANESQVGWGHYWIYSLITMLCVTNDKLLKQLKKNVFSFLVLFTHLCFLICNIQGNTNKRPEAAEQREKKNSLNNTNIPKGSDSEQVRDTLTLTIPSNCLLT